jgi:glycosyltransferase involved in cell wall biosynthesis
VPENTPLVSVIIPVYNGAATLPPVLAGLSRQSLEAASFEVIFADDCSTDDTRALLENYAPQASFRLKVLAQPQNRGASAARNLAAGAARGDYLVFIDADCVPDEQLLANHIAAQRQAGGTGIVGRIVWSAEFEGGPLAEYYKKIYFPGPLMQAEPPQEVVPFTYFVTSNASLPRRTFEQLGGFDEDFRYLWDDTVLGYRLEKAGYTLLLDRRALVYHHRPLLPGEALARFRRQGQEAMRLLAKYPELTGLVADPGEILADHYHQEELYRLLARYALGLGYAEGAARAFDSAELDALLTRPELATNFATWRDQRLELYRAELNELKDDQAKTRAYLRHVEAAYQRERQRTAALEAELTKEKNYSAKLEQNSSDAGLSLQVSILGQRLLRLYRRGRRGLANFATNRRTKE